ncbi:MAG: SPOR domain-containing protein [Acidobacteriota bacterium]|nr:SPOR domain-containing protein [Acidobacteriota bacterium]
MRRAAALLTIALLAPLARATQPLDMHAARRASASFRLAVRESQTIPVAGATAAWPIDAAILEVAVLNGSVQIVGRSAGRTKVVVITATGEQVYEVLVTGSASPTARKTAAVTTRSDNGTAEVRYSSAQRELQNSVAVTHETKTARVEIAARTVHYAEAPIGDRARTSVPAATIRMFTRGRELTLLDRDVDHSPLTLSNTPLRGIHYLDEHWRVHAGYTAYAAYQTFFVPVERELAIGAAYAFRIDARSHIVPGVFTYRNHDGDDGTVASLLYEYDDDDRLAARAELGYSNGFGAAVQFEYATPRDNAQADVRYRPDSFAVVSPAMPRGLLADALWSHVYGRASNAALSLSVSEIGGIRVAAGSVDVEHRLKQNVALTGGVSYGQFDRARSLTIPAGVRFDFARGGFGALVRYAQSDTNRAGIGGRLFGRASLGRFSASAYADYQQNAPTLELIFREQPELALALHDLGITATTPADIARALRENAELIELGFIEGVTVDLAPVRTQLGFELAWRGASASRPQLRARFAQSVAESVATRNTSTIASLTYSRRLTEGTDLFAGYSYWRSERRGERAQTTPMVEVGLRRQFDGLPGMFGGGSGAISGVVFADEDLDGVSDGTPVAALVDLDGANAKATNADGTFAFTNVPRGAHRVAVRIPERPDAYFTTPSRVEVEPGNSVAFGVAYTPARVFGRVMTDASDGIAGVRVLLARGANQMFATTNDDGRFTLAAAPGEWQLSILTDSVPAGFSLAGTEARAVILDRAQPLHPEYTLRANRSISGSGALANSEIEVRPHGKRVRADEQGRFSIRALPAGKVTVVANGVAREVELPHGPAVINVDVAPQVAQTAAPAVHTQAVGERSDTMHGYVVAIGAFRVHANAIETVERARRSGVEASLTTSGPLTIVRAGPYETRGDAAAIAERLTHAGLEAIVLSRN